MSDWVSACVVGVDIGGSKISAGLVTPKGEILQTRSVATPSTPSVILSEVTQLCNELIAGFRGEIVAIGIGSAGIVDSKSGQVIHANDNLPGWTGAPLSALEIGDGLPVLAENDARALSYGEAKMGAGRDYASLLCVTVGTGIGGGIILDGEIWRGPNYSAGEIGYLVVGWEGDKPIILDQFVSGPGIERAYQASMGAKDRIPLTEITRRAYAGELVAAQIIKEKARQLGIILGGFVAAINPAALVLGGGVSQIGALWWDALEAAFRESVPSLLRSTPILPAKLGAEAVLLGAAMLAWDKTTS
ncbi:MAG: ROK family protein [Chloroflexi bacterium]|nr:ROK family protein [Chloroflexota bacterium]